MERPPIWSGLRFSVTSVMMGCERERAAWREWWHVDVRGHVASLPFSTSGAARSSVPPPIGERNPAGLQTPSSAAVVGAPPQTKRSGCSARGSRPRRATGGTRLGEAVESQAVAGERFTVVALNLLEVRRILVVRRGSARLRRAAPRRGLWPATTRVGACPLEGTPAPPRSQVDPDARRRGAAS